MKRSTRIKAPKLLPIHLHAIADALAFRLVGEATSLHRRYYKAALDWATGELLRLERSDPGYARRYGLPMGWRRDNTPKRKPAKKRRASKK